MLTSDRDLGDAVPFPPPYVGEYLLDGVLVNYLPPLGLRSASQWKRALRGMLASEVVYINSLFAKQHTILPLCVLALTRYKGTVVISPRGETATSALRLGNTMLKRVWLNVLRGSGFLNGTSRGRRIVWLASSPGERDDILRLFSAATVLVSPERLRPLTDHGDPAVDFGAPMRIVSVGRIARVKGTIDLVRALQHVRHPVQLRLVGLAEDAEYARQVRDDVARLPSHVSVEWLGPLAPAEIDAELRRSRLFALLTHGENFGHAIGEALQAGCPVLISDQTPWTSEATGGAVRVLTDDQCRRPREVAFVIDELAELTADEWLVLSGHARAAGARGIEVVGSKSLRETIEFAQVTRDRESDPQD